MALLLVLCAVWFGLPHVRAEESPHLISSAEDLVSALASAQDGDTLFVGDITFTPMPFGMIPISKNLTIKAGDGRAVFTNATFSLNGSAPGAEPLAVRFEGIDFRGDYTGDPTAIATASATELAPTLDSTMPGILQTMCAGIFKQNLDVTYAGCTFEGYHYGYGGVLNAIYESGVQNLCRITLEDCVFRRNAGKYGGCLYLDGAGNIILRASRCLFENNAATTGGAIWAKQTDVRLLSCAFRDNRGLESDATMTDGGALALLKCSADLDGCLFTGNETAGVGGGVFCKISPFNTLVMRNCTLYRNTAGSFGGLAVELADTNFTSVALAHLFLTSIVGNRSLDADNTASATGSTPDRTPHVSYWGCLLAQTNAADGAVEEMPSVENGYCLTLSADDNRLVPDAATGHISCPADDRFPALPAEVLKRVDAGRFADAPGTFLAGDNYRAAVCLTLETAPKTYESVTLRYGDRWVAPVAGERRGFAFAGWQFPKGTPIDGVRFLGGTLPDAPITAHWDWQLRGHLYLIWVPCLLLLLALALFLAAKAANAAKAAKAEEKEREARDRSDSAAVLSASSAAQAPLAAENAGENSSVLPEGWIDRVCKKPEIVSVLSAREIEVLHKLLEGKRRREIADELFVTEATIRKHSTNIYNKLKVGNRTELLYKVTQ